MLQTRYHLRWILLSGMLVSIAKVNDCAQAIDSALKLAETVLKAAAAVSSATAVEYLTQRIQSIQWGNAAAGITTPTVAAAIVKGSTDLSVAMGTSTIASAATSAAGSGAGVGAGVGLGTVAATAFASVFAEPLVELF